MLAQTTFMREDIPMGLRYEALIAAFEREMGRWDQVVETALIDRKAPWEQVEGAFQKMAGPHGLMIFFHVNQGRLVSLTNGIKRCSLYIVGNGVIAEKILTIDVFGFCGGMSESHNPIFQENGYRKYGFL
jgi:hypothetical protein